LTSLRFFVFHYRGKTLGISACFNKVKFIFKIAFLLHDVKLGDTQKAKTLLGWEPKLTLEEGLKEVIAFSQAHPLHQGLGGYSV
jgi:nucleoside-diphosphate-sugar epimerase